MGSDFAGHIVTDHIKVISIHAPRMGSDQDANHVLAIRNISIHAPRMGSDAAVSTSEVEANDFYPRPPHGERRAGGAG